jgi:hypothetical protein
VNRFPRVVGFAIHPGIGVGTGVILIDGLFHGDFETP